MSSFSSPTNKRVRPRERISSHVPCRCRLRPARIRGGRFCKRRRHHHRQMRLLSRTRPKPGAGLHAARGPALQRKRHNASCRSAPPSPTANRPTSKPRRSWSSSNIAAAAARGCSIAGPTTRTTTQPFRSAAARAGCSLFPFPDTRRRREETTTTRRHDAGILFDTRSASVLPRGSIPLRTSRRRVVVSLWFLLSARRFAERSCTANGFNAGRRGRKITRSNAYRSNSGKVGSH